MNHRGRIIGWAVLALSLVLFFALAGGQLSGRLDDLSEKANRNAEAARVNEEAADANARNAERLREQVERLGGTPVVGSDDIAEPTGEAVPELSRGDVSAAVAAYCATGACEGEDGAPGRSVTPEQVAAAVSSFCDTNGDCRGPRGDAGTDGQQGAPGETGATGAQGPPPTAEQVAAAVADFCADNRCRGPQGPAGQDGKDGADGRGISGVSCDSVTPLELTITYSTGATETVTCGGVQ